MNKDLGPGSYVSRVVVNALYTRLMRSKKPRVEMLFDDWRRVFKQVCGYSPEKIKGLEGPYGLEEKGIDYEALLFSVHTYFALVMKLLAAEVAVSLGDSYLQSYIKKLEDAYLRGPVRLREMLKDLEEGAIFARIEIRNFLEADYFAWYLDVWDEALAEAISKLAKTLSDYEPATVELEPDEVKDMLKRLYQYLVPKKIRHDLGEYYTPDWLAELVINEVGYNGDLEKRFLDPACGSGTFLILAIKRTKQYALDNFVNESDALDKVLKNVVGFDLNPLAVIAARTNYLIALGGLIRYRKGSIEIPVYLADSILVERKSTLTGTAYILRTAAGEFMVPASIVDRNLLANILAIIEECVRNRYTKDEFKARLLKEVNIDEAESSILVQLYTVLLKLEEEGRNRIWVSVLKNSFAPLFAGKFDYVMGNPPWVAWENLPQGYREPVKQLYEMYHIMPTHVLAKVKLDISMLFVYRCMDRYLNNLGDFGFLITESVFKSIAGGGFRRFSINNMPIGVLKVHDMTDLKPFEGAQNRTAIFIAKKNCLTEYPVPYIIWKKRVRGEVGQNLLLDEVQEVTERIDTWAEPLVRRIEAPWISFPNRKTLDKLRRVIGRSAYVAHSGVDCALYGVYRIRILDGFLGEAIIRMENLYEAGKKTLKKITTRLEPELVYPYIIGSDVRRWRALPSIYAIIPHDPRNGNAIEERKMKIDFPRAYAYFKEFEKELLGRGTYKMMGKRGPFYSVFKIGDYTFSPYKVIWRYIADDFICAVISSTKDQYLGEKVVIPDHRLMLIGLTTESEAHFVCSVLNSSITRLIVRSYTVGTQISTHVLEYIMVPIYEAKNEIHKKLNELSVKAHDLAIKGQQEQLIKVEEEIDQFVAQLYGLTDEELEEVRISLRILEGKPTEVEEVVEEAEPKLGPKRALEELIKEFKEEA